MIDRSANIPSELRDRPQWVAAHISPSKKRPGKTEKIPVNPTTNQYADSSDPTTWGTLAAALACQRRGPWQGIGFVFSQDDPYCGIDFDDVIDQDGNVEQWALDYVRLLDSYTERSQSGKGLHIITRAALPPEGRKKGPVEMYDAGRFFVFTGDVLEGYTAVRDAQAAVDLVHRETFGPPAPPARQPQVTRQPGPLDDARLIDKLRACRGGKYAALWAGRLTGYASQSEADLALCHGLAFYAGGDAATVDRLFRQSGLYREKWDQPHFRGGTTYGAATIAKALSGLTQFYDGNGREPGASPASAPSLPDEPEWMTTTAAPGVEPSPSGLPPAAPSPNESRPALPQRKTTWTAAELLAAHFPEPQWAVPGIIPTGLTFLAGRPKVGKSWLALQIAIAVGTGGMVLDRHIAPGRVLYLALEDNARRLQERTRKQGMPPAAAIRFETAWRRFTDGGLEDLYNAIREDKITLAIVDTLGRALGRADQSDLADMTDLVGGLQEFAVTRDIAVLVLDHHRKPAGFEGNPIDDIVGSTAKSAVADAALGLFTQQGKRGATLKVTGRDVEWQDLVLGWDTTTCCWQYEGTTEEVAREGRVGEVLAVLQEHYPEMLTADEIAKLCRMQRANVVPLLNDLTNKGYAERIEKQGKQQPFRAMKAG